MRYFITLSCYGARVHGDEFGSVDRRHNVGNRILEPDPECVALNHRAMCQPAEALDHDAQAIALIAIRRVCSFKRWNLLAVYDRTNHVHVVVEGAGPPERMMDAFKTYASRALNDAWRDEADRRRWSRQGSTRRLFKDQDACDAIRYVVDEQRDPMAVFVVDVI